MNTTEPKRANIVLRIGFVAIVAILYFICTIFFTGCSVLKKHKTVTKTSIDSTATTSKTEVSKAKTDSNTIVIDKETGTKIAEATWEKETVIEDYVEPKFYGNASDGEPAFRAIDPADLGGRKHLLTDGGYYTFDSIAKILLYHPPIIRKTTIKERGTTTEKYDFIFDHSQITEFNKETADSNSENTAVEVKKKEATKTKDVERKATPIWVWALLVGFVVLMLFLGWRRWKKKIKSSIAGYITGV